MYRLICVILVFGLCFVSLIKCDDFDLKSQSNTLLIKKRNNLNHNLPAVSMGDFLLMLNWSSPVNKPVASNFARLNKTKRKRRQVDSDNDRSIDLRQELSLQPYIAPYLEPLRTWIKRAYKMYLTLNPEVRLGQCMVKQLYIEYPELMRFFRTDYMRTLIQRAYNAVLKLYNNILNDIIFAFFDNEADRKQIESKVAMVNFGKRIKKKSTSQKVLDEKMSYNYNFNPAIYNQLQVYRRFKRQASCVKPNQKQPHQENIHIESKQSNAKPTQLFDIDLLFDDVANIDNKTLEREADELFNFELIFWRTLGIDEKSIKKYSPAYCGREYVTGIFSRFVKNVILS